MNRCGIKFNTKSVNYDMSEIELPAYCKTHPEGKLLFIITPHSGQESELGCVYCALDLNQNKDKYTIIEIKQKLNEYITHTSELLQSKPRSSNNEDIIMKIGICKDREIAMIRQYYDKMMEALTLERDRLISQITSIAEDNIDTTYQSSFQHKTTEQSKADIKLKNFGNELGKVLDGVEETGIHIKELWKINQDYNDIVKQKVTEGQNVPGLNSSELKSFEFHIADENSLKDLVQKVGQVVTRPVSLDYFIYDEYENSNRRSPNMYKNSYSHGYTPQFNKIEYVPTFGVARNSEDVKRYTSDLQSTENMDMKYQYSGDYEKPVKYGIYEASNYESCIPPSYNFNQSATSPISETLAHSQYSYNYTAHGNGNGYSPEYKISNNPPANMITSEYTKGHTYTSPNHITSEDTKTQQLYFNEGRYNIQTNDTESVSRAQNNITSHSYPNMNLNANTNVNADIRTFGGERTGYTYTNTRGQDDIADRVENTYGYRASEERYSRPYIESTFGDIKGHHTYTSVSYFVLKPISTDQA